MGLVFYNSSYISVFALCFALLAKVSAMDFAELNGRWVLEAIDGKEVGSGGAEIYFQITEQSILALMAAIGLEEAQLILLECERHKERVHQKQRYCRSTSPTRRRN